QIAEQRRQQLEADLATARAKEYVPKSQAFSSMWSTYQGGDEAGVPEVPTGLPVEQLAALLESQALVPEDFHPHPKIQKLLTHRLEMARGERPLDWAAGELLAYASLAAEGVHVRLTG